jgi:hypothetical protein
VSRYSRPLAIFDRGRVRRARWTLAFVIGVTLAVGIGLVFPI